MTRNASNNAPPAYQPSDIQALQLFNRLQDSLDTHGGGRINHSPEKERMHNFLLYCLAVDYQSTGDFALSAEDAQHYLHMHNLLRDLQRSHSQTTLYEEERRTLAPYFWKYLHEPCKNLSIPVESAGLAVTRFGKYRSIYNQYKGCAHGLLHTLGLRHLAQKILMDKNVLVLRLATSVYQRKDLIGSVNALSRVYFNSIEGVDSVVLPNVSDDDTFWDTNHSITYNLNKRGQKYQSTRAQAIDFTKRCSILGPDYLLNKALACLPRLRARRGGVPFDTYNPWRVRARVPADTTIPGSIYSEPFWAWNKNFHLPDLFEYRPGGHNRCDA